MPRIEPDGPEGPEAFAAVAHRLDALLQGKAKAEGFHGATEPRPEEQAASALEPVSHIDSAGEIDLDLPPDAMTGDAGAFTPEPETPRPITAGDLGADLMSTMNNLDAILSGAEADVTDCAAEPVLDPASADDEIPDLDVAADSETLDAVDTAAEALGGALPDTATDDPSANDLDAELAALLAESPIDPEVLGAADEIAQRDAVEAEQNQEALRLRAEQAALALEQDNTGPAIAEGEITDEINALLVAEESLDETQAVTDDPPAADPSIDQIDQMLAADADDDIDLDGAFFSADDVLTGNTAGPGEGLDEFDDDLEGDFAAAEDVPAPEPAHDSADAETEETGDPTPAWQRLLRLADTAGLHLCWLLNWPARKFLSAEWRSTLGYVALLQAVGATAVWLLLVVL